MRKWALISVYNKEGIVEFAQALVASGYGILSTGGTARHLTEAGIAVTQVEDYTGFPEMMDGRVKTLHPKIHGGLLGLRDNPEHAGQMQAHGIDAIDVVVVNLYPFAATIARPGVTYEEAIEQIDIGGPSMLRSAAKNHSYCAPVIDPADYTWVADKLALGELALADRQRLAAKVFASTAQYDATIAAYLQKQIAAAATSDSSDVEAAGEPVSNLADALGLPGTYVARSLRYGENPHQQASFLVESNASPATLGGARQLQGKELSYNNIQDADAALSILRSLDDMNQAAVVAVKHMNPCGVGLGSTAEEAFTRAYEADPVSIFGGIIAVNREVDSSLAKRLTSMFLEIVMAPSFTDEALAAFAKKKNVRLLVIDVNQPLWRPGAKLFKRVSGGLLLQDVDTAVEGEWRVVTRRAPDAAEAQALKFAWRIVKFVKSNAILLATDSMTVGVGAGQMNRVGAAKIAIEQAGPRAVGSVLASDAFFPMRDTVDTAAAAGIKAIIQPGGSIKDEESIAAADEHGIAMVFTGQRHFLH